MLNRKYLIVGSGIVGCVIAHELAQTGADVSVIERRHHIGGNLYDFVDKYGIRVHLYGPHIFHTKEERLYNYVSKFCRLNDYNLVCGAVIDGICVRTTFDFAAIDTFFPSDADEIKARIKREFGDQETATVLEMLESEDPYVRKFAQFLYEKDYKPYTAKQWGVPLEKIDRQIFRRVPILLSYGSRYFNDAYQAIPANGYMELIKNLLDGIKVQTDVDVLEHITVYNKHLYYDGKLFDGEIVYTGPIDELFQCRYGKLPYRSLRFEWKHEDIDSFQDMPVVAYPQAEGFTRITEYKKLPYQDVRGTSYAVEYPLPYERGNECEPYYPVLTDESKKLFDIYNTLASETNGLYCCGRLADYKYYDMDQAIKRALEVAESIKGAE